MPSHIMGSILFRLIHYYVEMGMSQQSFNIAHIYDLSSQLLSKGIRRKAYFRTLYEVAWCIPRVEWNA